jgi:limonene-1,2-epoxide hydrolase
MADVDIVRQNDRLVREVLRLWERRDVDRLVAACTEDAVWHHRPLAPAVGSAGIRAFAEHYADVPGGPYEILRQVAGAAFVLNERLDRVSGGSAMVELPVCGVFEIEGGLIKAWRDYFDTSGFGAFAERAE